MQRAYRKTPAGPRAAVRLASAVIAGLLATAPAFGQRTAEADARDVARATRTAPDPAALEALTKLLEDISDRPLYRNNHVRLLLDGPQTYDAMLEAIADARHSVHLETYIFSDGEVGERFADALIAKARGGVPVRVIYDSLGSRASEHTFFDRMEQAGVEVYEFNPPETPDAEGGITRDHRKMLIVDGAVAFTGGLNIDEPYEHASQAVSGRGRGPIGWRDTHVEIRGPAAAGFQELFVDAWESFTEKELDREALGDPPRRAGRALVRVLGAVGGNEGVSQIRIAYEAAIDAARESVLITQSYFAPDDAFIEHITAASARGVDVRILVAGYSDSQLLVDASRSHYTNLLEAGVRIFESQEWILHAKTAVVDGVWSTVGSSNLDSLSFIHNHEVNAVILAAEFGRELEALFAKDVENSVEIVLEEWSKRSLWQRAKELWATLLEYRL